MGNGAGTLVSVDGVGTLAGAAEPGSARLAGAVAVEASVAGSTDADVAALVASLLADAVVQAEVGSAGVALAHTAVLEAVHHNVLLFPAQNQHASAADESGSNKSS